MRPQGPGDLGGSGGLHQPATLICSEQSKCKWSERERGGAARDPAKKGAGGWGDGGYQGRVLHFKSRSWGEGGHVIRIVNIKWLDATVGDTLLEFTGKFWFIFIWKQKRSTQYYKRHFVVTIKADTVWGFPDTTPKDNHSVFTLTLLLYWALSRFMFRADAKPHYSHHVGADRHLPSLETPGQQVKLVLTQHKKGKTDGCLQHSPPDDLTSWKDYFWEMCVSCSSIQRNRDVVFISALWLKISAETVERPYENMNAMFANLCCQTCCSLFWRTQVELVVTLICPTGWMQRLF